MNDAKERKKKKNEIKAKLLKKLKCMLIFHSVGKTEKYLFGEISANILAALKQNVQVFKQGKTHGLDGLICLEDVVSLPGLNFKKKPKRIKGLDISYNVFELHVFCKNPKYNSD